MSAGPVQIVERATGRVVGGAFRFRPKSEHPADCQCSVCDVREIPCPILVPDPEDPESGERVACGRLCIGRKGLGVHVAWAHKRRRRGYTRVLVPEGLGYLKAVLRDPHRAAGLHLGELPKFAQRLARMGETDRPQTKRKGGMKRGCYSKRARRLTKAALLLAEELSARSPDEPFPLFAGGVKVPAALAQLMLQIAHEADVAPKTVAVALLSYGLEALAKELRQWKTAPEPRLVPSSPLLNAKQAELVIKAQNRAEMAQKPAQSAPPVQLPRI